MPRSRNADWVIASGEASAVEAGLIPKKDSVEEEDAAMATGRARVAGAVMVSRIVVVMTCVLTSKEVTVSVTVTATVGQSDIVPVLGGRVELLPVANGSV
jgi:hypothetical protein